MFESEEGDNRLTEWGGAPTHLVPISPASDTLSGARLTDSQEMASPSAGREVPDASPQDEPEPSAQPHPEPACLEAQKWIEVSEETLREAHGPAATAPRDRHVHYWGI
ncbi:Phenol hydroxylase P2 protein [Dissostichus eleginoides]|uniref:Phenol hydroxylase P2 protein n=1 Tax=Dissostichus eleginoides TaxID=100907 RepID=A0AAD9BQE7_DISEL|nr:Phenol hydroxylase P2 protein [Dissostichus eleginoides]